MRQPPSARRAQEGVATLLVALVLMMALTVVTLSVARTQLVEQRVASNQHWHTRLFLQAEAGLADAVQRLERPSAPVDWHPGNARQSVVGRMTLDNGTSDVKTSLLWRRRHLSPGYVFVQSTSERDDGSGWQVRISRLVRPLSVLSPAAESAPPLVVNGCIALPAAGLDIRPLDADQDPAGDAIWLTRDAHCPPLSGIEVHQGRITERALGEDLWSTVFSVDRDSFSAMAADQERLPEVERTYWTAQSEDLVTGRWLQSLGTSERPVALYFPPDLGCPQFAPGVRIHGLVFIDVDCTGSVATHSFELYGSLVVNGNLDTGESRLQLNHIQVADDNQCRLRFPVLRSVAVPGSWSDF